MYVNFSDFLANGYFVKITLAMVLVSWLLNSNHELSDYKITIIFFNNLHYKIFNVRYSSGTSFHFGIFFMTFAKD